MEYFLSRVPDLFPWVVGKWSSACEHTGPACVCAHISLNVNEFAPGVCKYA